MGFSLGDIFGSDLFAMSGIRNPEMAAMALGIGAGLGGGFGGGGGSSLMAGGGSSAAPASAPPLASPMPVAKPGLMGRAGNPSWWKAILGDNPDLPMLLNMLGQQGGDQPPQQAPLPQPPQAQMNPMAVQMAMAMMQGQGRGGPPPMSGAPGLYGGF